VQALLAELLAALGAEDEVVAEAPRLVEDGAPGLVGDVDGAGAVVLGRLLGAVVAGGGALAVLPVPSALYSMRRR
jgi:hypothetical protein